jgi:hypothetical protein
VACSLGPDRDLRNPALLFQSSLRLFEEVRGACSMILIVLTCISITLLAVCWFLYRRNIELFLCILIAAYSEFFYLIPQIKGPEDYKLLLLPIILILLFESLLSRKLALGRYGWWVISFLIISLFGVIVANLSGQSFVLGIKAAKFIPLVMVYFLLPSREIKAEKFIKYFIVMALAVAFISTIQYILKERINLFPGVPMERFTGKALDSSAVFRVTIGQFIIPVAAVAALARYGQSSRLSFLFVTIALSLEVLFVQQTRMLIVALFLSMVLVYTLSHKLTPLRIATYSICAGVCVTSMLLVSVSDLRDVPLIKRSVTDFEKHRGSYQGRIYAYTYYWNAIEKRPLTGYGILNFNWEGNAENTLQKKGIHLSDIGIIHFIWQAGLIGFIWLVYGLSKLWRDALRFREQLPISSYFIVAIFTLPTIDMLLRNDDLFLFAIFLGLSANMISARGTKALPEKASWMHRLS